MTLYDLSHTVTPGMVTYPGLPGPEVSDHLSREASRAHYAPGTTFQIGRVSMVASTGTYVDAPLHRYAYGADVAALPLASLADLPAVVLSRAPDVPPAVDAAALAGLDVAGCAVLVRTGHDRHWGTPAYHAAPLPHLTRCAALHLRDAGAALVGIDALNIDSMDDPERPVHTILLGAGVPIVENLANLGALPDSGARFFAVPPPMAALGSFPVRAFALA